jgi:crotonobetainyl-CoA:carnitine CoA-transferase CaiB-like acyl-CoA transferase
MSNRGKKAISVDLSTSDGHRVLEGLVERADVFITNLRPQAKAGLGVDYGSIRAVNPMIVHLKVSAFGPKGEYADVGGFDPLGQAMSGMMFLSGADEPSLQSVIVLDQLTAITASHAVLSALVARDRQGHGQELDVSLLSSAMWLQYANLLFAANGARPLDLAWDRTAVSPLRTTFCCADGGWIMGTNHPPRDFAMLSRALGLEDLPSDERFGTEQLRKENAAALYEILDARFLTKPRHEWLDVMHRCDMFFAPVNSYADVLRDDQVKANDLIVELPHPVLGTLSVPGYPVRFGRDTAGRPDPAPALGEHTHEVLAGLGYDTTAIERLHSCGVVRTTSWAEDA